MSGIYPGRPTCTWQREHLELLEGQLDEVITPFGKQAEAFAGERGVKIVIKMHPGQVVYNTRGVLRLREIAGPNIGANFDLSHIF